MKSNEVRHRALAILRDRHRDEYERIKEQLRNPPPLEGQRNLLEEGIEVSRVRSCACGRSIVTNQGEVLNVKISNGVRTVEVDGRRHHECVVMS